MDMFWINHGFQYKKLSETGPQGRIDQREYQHADREIGIVAIKPRLGISERRETDGLSPFGDKIAIKEVDARTHKSTPTKADKDVAWKMNAQIETRPTINE